MIHHTIIHHAIPRPERRRHGRSAPVVRKPDRSGYIVFLDDEKKLGAVKVIGRKTIPVTPYRTMAWFKVDDLGKGLQAVYNELREFRVTGDWYVQDAVEMYLDHRQGRC